MAPLGKKVSLKNFLYIFLLDMNFENLIIEFRVSYVFNMYIKFHSN